MGPMMVIDSDILIDFARKEVKAVDFLETALREDVAKPVIPSLSRDLDLREKPKIPRLRSE